MSEVIGIFGQDINFKSVSAEDQIAQSVSALEAAIELVKAGQLLDFIIIGRKINIASKFDQCVGTISLSTPNAIGKYYYEFMGLIEDAKFEMIASQSGEYESILDDE